MIIGVCGKSGSGKTYFSNLQYELCKVMFGINDFKHKECDVLHIDEIGHKVLDIPEVQEEIKEKIGVTVSSTNRKELSDKVFSDRDAYYLLEDITWKAMEKEIDKWLSERENYAAVVLDWALLPESKYFDMCDITYLLDIPYKVRLRRCMKRDHISKEDFDKRDKNCPEYDKNKFSYVMTTQLVKKHIRLIKKAIRRRK